MSILDRKYYLKANISTSKIESKNIHFYNTDKNTSVLYLKLKYVDDCNLEKYFTSQMLDEYTIKLTVVKPKTMELVELNGVKEDNMFKFELPSNFTDQVGKCACEIILSNATEDLTLDEFTYNVKASSTTKFNAEIEQNPDLPILKQLIKEVKETAQTVNNIDNVNVSDTKTYSNKKIEEKFSGVDAQFNTKANQSDLEIEKNRLDNIIVNNNPTEGNSELIDGRVGADGKTYSNLGGAVRGQIIKLKETLANKEIGSNKFNKNALVNGFLNTNGSLTDSTSYFTSEFIEVKQGVKISIKNVIRKFLAYDINKNPIIESYQTNGQTDYTYLPTQDGYIRISVQDLYIPYIDVTYSDTVRPEPDYEPYKVCLENDTELNTKHLAQVEELIKNQNILYGKKWVTCGDSFTEGDFSNSPTNNYIFTEGKYKGQKKVYPFFIGNRNNMEIINEAKCGTTIAHKEGKTNAFVDGRYMQIPTDADYITLKFGINDKGYSVPLGTIDDVVNDTFYGAWNIVMEYLLTNHPFAKIGIIIGNGMQTENTFPNAIKEIAKKWGVPYLDEAFGENVPLMHRTNKSFVCQKAKDLKFSNFSVKVGINEHPNEKAHEYESTFVENFLRSL